MRLVTPVLLVALSTTTIAPVFAQRIAPPPPPPDPLAEEAQKEAQKEVVRLGVELVQVDVVVTDSKGRRVKGLQPADFEIYEDGVKQQVTNFDYVEGTAESAAKASPDAPAGPRMKRDDEAPAPPPRKLEADDIRRVFALVVDDLFLSFEHVKSVKIALRKFVDEEMRPGDLVAIVLTSKGSSSLQQFSADKRLLLLSIDRIKWNPNGARGLQTFDTSGQDLAKYSILRAGRNQGASDRSSSPDSLANGGSGMIQGEAGPIFEGAVTSNSGSRPTGTEAAGEFRDEAFSVGSLGALDYVVRSLAGLPGRKSLVWFTEGFELFSVSGYDEPTAGGKKGERRSLEITRRLADRTNRAGVTFYPVDVRGVTVPYMLGADADPYDKPYEARKKEVEKDGRKLRDSQDVMYYLANQTGGIVYTANDPAVGIRRAVEDQESFYLIGYVPPAATFAGAPAASKYHDIQIKVKREGLKVRSRSGFLGRADDATAPQTPAAKLAAAMLSPVGTHDIGVELSSQYLGDGDAVTVRSTLHVDAEDLSFTANPDGSQTAVFDVVAFATGESGEPESMLYDTKRFTIPADEMAELREHGIVYTIELPIAKYGAYQIRTAIQEQSTGRIGAASEFLVVPDLSEKRLEVSGLSLKGDPAPGRFAPGSAVTYAFAVYNAKVDETAKRAKLRLRISLWRDDRQVVAGQEAPIDLKEQLDWKRINVVGGLKLSPKLAPGDYTLQIDVVDTLAGRKNSAATQWIDFEVIDPVARNTR
jgi:VWFA-related protein